MDGYRQALDLARRDLAEAVAKKAKFDAEVEQHERTIARLRVLIESLASLIGEPSDLPDAKPGGHQRPQPPAPRTTTEAGRTNDDKVLHALRNGPLPPKTIQELTGIPRETMFHTLTRMVISKTLTKSGMRRSCRYQVTPT